MTIWSNMKTVPKDGGVVWLLVKWPEAKTVRVIPARYDSWNGYFRNWPDGNAVIDEYNLICWWPFEYPAKPDADLIRDFEKANRS